MARWICSKLRTVLQNVFVLVALIVAFGCIFYSKVEEHEPITNSSRRTNFTLPVEYRQYFDSFAFAVPVFIVDTVLLREIVNGNLPLKQYMGKLIVAVDKRFKGQQISENDDKLIVVYYSNQSERDYWLFETGDEKRAILPMELYNYSVVSLPYDIESFLEDWKHSRFIKCRNLIKRNITEERTIPVEIIRHMAELRDFIKMKDARLMLFGGTLLGWYRECSLIPHTRDIDFAIRNEEYSPSIVTDLDARDSPYKLARILGFPSNSYELTVRVKKAPKVMIDIFFLYTSTNESYVSGLDWYTRKKYKWSYPRIFSVCTADLLGSLFHVPCNTEHVLKIEYGDWKSDTPTTEFVWNKSHRNVRQDGTYSEEEMSKMRPDGWRWFQDLVGFFVRRIT